MPIKLDGPHSHFDGGGKEKLFLRLPEIKLW
jgi:hypothetical protein